MEEVMPAGQKPPQPPSEEEEPEATLLPQSGVAHTLADLKLAGSPPPIPQSNHPQWHGKTYVIPKEAVDELNRAVKKMNVPLTTPGPTITSLDGSKVTG